MTTTDGQTTYEWIENWARIPETPSGKENGRTHGVAVLNSGNVVVFNQADPAVLIFSPDGELVDSWGDRFLGAHGLTLVEEDGVEYLWLTDQNTAEVVKMTLDGQTVQNLERPDLPVYAEKGYAPTWVAVDEVRHGGSGDIWVTDGYGAGLVSRYSADGSYVETIDGSTGAGTFSCPHGIWMDTRCAPHELYVADRGNHRIQVFNMDGSFNRCFGAEVLDSPDGFAPNGDQLIVPELFGRLAVLGVDGELIGYLGEQPGAKELAGWPNLSPERLEEGKCNSPHGATADAAGNIYYVEWIIGGRITKLERQG